MTCIVGWVDKSGDIYFGGDSAAVGVGNLSLEIRKDVKVFKKKNMIFGFTTSFRMGQLLMFKLDIPYHPPKLSDYEYMCTDFIDGVRKCLKDNGYSEVDKNVEKVGEFLVGYRGRIYHIYNDLQVGMMDHNYDACGCGRGYAIGSLATNDENICPKKVILKALEVAEKFSGGVRKPFRILKLKSK